MSDVPSNLIPTRITGLPEYLGTSTLGYLPYVIEGNTYKVQFTNIAAVGAVPSTREINTGSGLGGGGDLSANRTLYILPEGVDDSRLTTTGVTAATYGAADSIPVFTVNAQGRVTGVTDTPIILLNYVPTSRTITAGDGLTGGGDLSANRSFAVNFSSTTPEPLGPGSPGVSTVAAREDHVHPAVDLSDTTETQGVLPLSRGGTGNSLSPVVGAIAYSSNDKLYLTPTAGNAGQVLTSDGGGVPYWSTVTGVGTVTSVDLTAGTGISVSGGPITGAGSINVVNTAPDQVVSLTGAGLTTITGTYPNFTITSTGGTGTVSSVDASGGTTGLSFTGGPITSTGTLTLGGTLGVANGGTGATTLEANGVLYGSGTSAIAATAVGATGQVLFGNTGAAPSWAALASNAVTSFSAGTTGLTPSTGTTGSITLSGTLAVANGGTGATVAATARTNLGAAASGANTDITSIALTTGTISTAPASNNDIANKQYVDTVASSGIHYHQPVRVESPINLNATYDNGTAGVGATLTNAGTQAALVIDGVTVDVADRVLVYEQTDATQNGIYVVTSVGSGSTNWVLTRSSDADTFVNASPNGLSEGSTVFVQQGTTGAGETYTCNTVGTITFGTTNITFTQISAAQIYSAGAGLTLTGTQFSLTAPVAVNLGGTGLSAVGTAGNVLTSDGTVWTSQPPAAGGITYTAVKTSSYSAANSEGVQTDTSGGAFTVTLPATPAVGDQVIVVDSAGSWATNNLTVGRNGSTIEGSATDLTCDISSVSVQFVYSGTTWDVYAQVGGASAGVISVAGGGTGATSLTGYVKGSGTSPLTGVATIPVADGGTGLSSPGTSGNVLTSDGTGWTSTALPSSAVQYPQNIQSADYTLVLGDAGKQIFHPVSDTTVRTYTIPANSSVAFPIGTVVMFTVENAGTAVNVAITSDTLVFGSGTTGTVAVVASNTLMAIKVTATKWMANYLYQTGLAASTTSIAVAHSTSPFITAYPWSGFGFGDKYANPATLPPNTGNGVAFSPAGDAIAVAHSSSPYVSAYPWSGSGFGTKYTNPGTLPTGSGTDTAFSPAGDAIAVSHSTSPFITAYPWDVSTGFGTKYANPATLPASTGQGVAFSPAGDAIAVAHNTTPFITAYPWDVSTGFGTKYTDPATLPPNIGQGVAFSPAGDAIALAHSTSPYISAYPWSGSGFGTKYANPATLPASTGQGVAFSPAGDAIAVAHNSSPYVSAYPWSGSGFGTKYTNPATLPASQGNGVAFSPAGDAIAVAHDGTIFVSAYPWDVSTGFGTKYTDPATPPTGIGQGVAFTILS